MGDLFNITHDGNNLDEYDSTVTDEGDLATGTPGLASTTARMEATIDDANLIYGQKDIAATNEIRIRIYIDPNGLSVGAGAYVAFLSVLDGANVCGSVYIEEPAVGGYGIDLWVVDDAHNWHDIGSDDVDDDEHYIEVHLIAASGPGQNDGEAHLWVDGVLIDSDTTLDTDARWVGMDTVRAGHVSDRNGTITGTYYLDELKANDDGGEIGPVAAPGGQAVRSMHQFRMRRAD